jgi:microcystin-dependent protein
MGNSATTAYAGTIILWGTSRIPSGWMTCQGQALSVAEYSNLYSVIGTRFGSAANGQFLLPNLRGRFPMGADPDNQFPMGQVKGNTQIFFKDSQFPPHSHQVIQSITPPTATLTMQAGIPYNATDLSPQSAPGGNTVFGRAYVNQNGSKKLATIYSTQKANAQIQMSISSPHISFSPITPTLTIGAPAIAQEDEAADGQPVPKSPNCIPYYQSANFIICVSGNPPPHPMNEQS